MALNLWQNLGLKVRQQSSKQTVETQQTAIANTAASRQHSRDSSQQTVLANRDTADGREFTTNAVRAATQVCIDSCEWPVDGPVHLSLEQIDKIALGGPYHTWRLFRTASLVVVLPLLLRKAANSLEPLVPRRYMCWLCLLVPQVLMLRVLLLVVGVCC